MDITVRKMLQGDSEVWLVTADRMALSFSCQASALTFAAKLKERIDAPHSLPNEKPARSNLRSRPPILRNCFERRSALVLHQREHPHPVVDFLECMTKGIRLFADARVGEVPDQHLF